MKEIARRTRDVPNVPNTYDEDVQPMYGPQPYMNDSYRSDVPEWMNAVPPSGYGDGVRDKVERTWSWIVRWPRALALGFLWCTYSIYRFVYVVGTAALILYALLR